MRENDKNMTKTIQDIQKHSDEIQRRKTVGELPLRGEGTRQHIRRVMEVDMGLKKGPSVIFQVFQNICSFLRRWSCVSCEYEEKFHSQ